MCLSFLWALERSEARRTIVALQAHVAELLFRISGDGTCFFDYVRT